MTTIEALKTIKDNIKDSLKAKLHTVKSVIVKDTGDNEANLQTIFTTSSTADIYDKAKMFYLEQSIAYGMATALEMTLLLIKRLNNKGTEDGMVK